MKVMVGSLSYIDSEITYESTDESIIPLQEENLITFTLFFKIPKEDVRGKEKRFTISTIFEREKRKWIYDNASYLSETLRNLSDIVKMHYISDEFTPEFLEKLDQLVKESIRLGLIENPHLKNKATITCPICSNKNLISINEKYSKLNIIEHKIFKGDVCPHQFTVYLDFKLNTLGYKEPEVNLSTLKEKLGSLKTPYNDFFEVSEN
ncbi:MAG: hypothetical protein HZR80_09620 [Candidatus Heimdallarchaeota archaeon]